MRALPVSFENTGASISSALTPAITIITRCAFCVPSDAIRTMLDSPAPTIAPTVFAAYTLPTSRAGS
jgi:hypothetical protein